MTQSVIPETELDIDEVKARQYKERQHKVPQLDSRPATDLNGLRARLGDPPPGRTSVYRWMQTDPAFPQPFTYPGGTKLYFFIDEIEAYKESRPRRQYVEEGAEK